MSRDSGSSGWQTFMSKSSTDLIGSGKLDIIYKLVNIKAVL